MAHRHAALAWTYVFQIRGCVYWREGNWGEDCTASFRAMILHNKNKHRAQSFCPTASYIDQKTYSLSAFLCASAHHVIKGPYQCSRKPSCCGCSVVSAAVGASRSCRLVGAICSGTGPLEQSANICGSGCSFAVIIGLRLLLHSARVALCSWRSRAAHFRRDNDAPPW